MPDAQAHARHWPQLYVRLCRELRRDGDRVAPRGQPTRELRDYTFLLYNVSSMPLLPLGVGRRVNTKLAAVEALQLCLGVELPTLVHDKVPALSPFAEDDGHFWGSYGARASDQLVDCYRKLKADVHSRQAVMSLWNPELDGPGGKRDHPCTLNLTFSVRHEELHLSVTMRSNDVWLGTAYDVFQFTQLQQTLACALGLRAGSYHHHAVSFHLYERDVAKTDSLTVPAVNLLHDNSGPCGFDLRGKLDGYDAHGEMKRHAASLLWPTLDESLLTSSELWYRRQLS